MTGHPTHWRIEPARDWRPIPRRRNRGQWLLVIGVLAACVVVGVVLGVIGGG